ncbi:aminodeoxychorismate synthase component I [Nibricoccus sp. IMCC34717]|uniref:aminodeoxychorismate synthase component I n=1 Tax=Nibricoccus sp. IMCC34717 TaxID=3034021 RepID=UPI003850E56B
MLESSLRVGSAGRYSLFGYEPVETLTAVPDGLRIERRDGSVETRLGDSWDLFCAHHRSRCRQARSCQERAFPFSGGAIGFLTYEAGLGWEKVPKEVSDEFSPAPFCFAYYDRFLIADEQEQQLLAVADAADAASDGTALAALLADVEGWRSLSRAVQTSAPLPDLGAHRWLKKFAAAFPPELYAKAVGRVRDYIASGDVYQVNLAQRFSAAWQAGREAELYAELQRRSPAPYASFLDVGGGVQIISCSPESFLRVNGREVQTRPIKGTRPRGQTAEADAANREALLASPKDRAELLMIVDLERNDLGRVCEPGSIRVDNLYQLETHPTVFHLVADVSGRLRENRDVLDLLRASFPGGSITGAPKVRAMQVISELEPVPRGVYTGAIGYLGLRGESEFAIAIRTLQCVGNRVHLHAGSGIVWDSEPGAEYDECLAKARAMAEAVVALSENQ